MKPTFLLHLFLSAIAITSLSPNAPLAWGYVAVPKWEQPKHKELLHEIVVNGNDDRRIMPKNSWVDTATVAIAKGAALDTVCTGTVIGLSHVITAAHCVYDTKTKKIKPDLTVVPALHMAGAHKPAPRFFLKKIYILKNYITDIGYNGYTSYAASKDIAILQVKEFKDHKYFEHYTKRLPIKDSTTIGHIKEFSVIAYTGGGNNTKSNSQYMQHRGCRSHGRNYHYTSIKHDCDTTAGSSGMAMLAEFPDKRGYIIGIHTGSSGSSGMNSAALIPPDVLEEINNKVLLFKTSGLKKFQVFQAPPVTTKGAYIGYQFRNNCSKTAEVNVIYKSIDGDQYMMGPLKLKPGELKIFGNKTYDRNILVRAVLSNGRRLTRNSKTYKVKGKKLRFQRMTFANKFTDNEIKLCK